MVSSPLGIVIKQRGKIKKQRERQSHDSLNLESRGAGKNEVPAGGEGMPEAEWSAQGSGSHRCLQLWPEDPGGSGT